VAASRNANWNHRRNDPKTKNTQFIGDEAKDGFCCRGENKQADKKTCITPSFDEFGFVEVS
jgi:hypothetical protein